MSDDCPAGRTKGNGNCPLPDPADGLPVQCVGAWVPEKHDYLRRYIEATHAVRSRYLPPRGPGGAAFIDLFAGPGRARVRPNGALIDGSPLIAARHTQSPFSDLLLCDLDSENVEGLRARLKDDSRVCVFHGDCNEKIAAVVARVPLHGLNMALLDPFGVTPLRFETIKALAQFERMDLILHFPTADVKRNFDLYFRQKPERIDRFVGTAHWRERVRDPEEVHLLAGVLREQLKAFGYGDQDDAVRYMPSIRTDQNVPLYHLAFVAKHPVAERIWQSVVRTEGSGQKRIF